jgi:hypothetical protein
MAYTEATKVDQRRRLVDFVMLVREEAWPALVPDVCDSRCLCPNRKRRCGQMTATPPPLEDATKKRPLTVVVKKKKTSAAKHSAKTSHLARKTGGLPRFSKIAVSSSSASSNHALSQQQDEAQQGLSADALCTAEDAKLTKHPLDFFLDDFDDDDKDESFPSEALIAIDTLTTSRRDDALEIPFPESGRPSIYGVLECQIQEFYRSKKKVAGFAQSLSRELEMLVESGRVVVLTTPPDAASATSLAVYVPMRDYLAGLHEALLVPGESPSTTGTTNDNDQQQKQQDVMLLSEWFAATIVARKGRRSCRFTHQELCASWNDHHTQRRQQQPKHPIGGGPSSSFAADAIVKTLRERQILLSSVQEPTLYQLSLPSWGKWVLPVFRKATKDALTFIKQSRYKERSVASLEKRLSHNPISVARLLLPWMVSQGLVQRREKPAGMFVSLAPS